MTADFRLRRAAAVGALLGLLWVASSSAAQPVVEDRAATAAIPAGPAVETPGMAKPGMESPAVERPAPVEVTRYPLPATDPQIRSLTAGPDGTIWFLDEAGLAITAFDSQARRFSRIEHGAGERAEELVIDGRRRIWLAGSGADYIGVLDTGQQRVAKLTLTRYPGLRVDRLAPDSDGIWFSAADRPALGRMDADGSQLELEPLTGLTGTAGDLAVADGAVWLAAASAPQIVRYDPVSGALSMLALPFAEARASQLLVVGDRVAVLDRGRGMLGLLDPRSGAYLEYPVPLRGELLAAGDGRGRIWLVTTGSQPQLVSFDAGSRRFSESSPLAVPVDGDAMIYSAHDAALWLSGDRHLIRVPVGPAGR